MTRDLILYDPRPSAQMSSQPSDITSSYTIRPPTSIHSRSFNSNHMPIREGSNATSHTSSHRLPVQENSQAMSHASSRYPPPRSSSRSSRSSIRPSTHTSQSSGTPSQHSSARSHGSSSKDSVYSSGSSYTKITSISTKTFGSPDQPGYAPRQAPRRYFKSIEVRQEWDNAPVNEEGVKVRSHSGGRHHGSRDGRSEWGLDVAPSSILSGSSHRTSEKDDRRPLGYEEARDDDTVMPEDSISMVSSKRSRGGWSGSGASGTRTKIYHYPRSGYSQRDDGRFEDDGVEVSNGKFVKERRPEWVC